MKLHHSKKGKILLNEASFFILNSILEDSVLCVFFVFELSNAVVNKESMKS